MDLFVVPTIGFSLLYALVIVRPRERIAHWTRILTRPAQRVGRIVSHALVGGLHHQYVRI
jgi:hypothetical protein